MPTSTEEKKREREKERKGSRLVGYWVIRERRVPYIGDVCQVNR